MKPNCLDLYNLSVLYIVHDSEKSKVALFTSNHNLKQQAVRGL